MTALAFAIGALMIGLGLVGCFSPDRLLRLVERLRSPRGLLALAVYRAAAGWVLLAAAPASRAPVVVCTIGIVAVFSGVTTACLALPRLQGIVDWWMELVPSFLRAAGVGACLLGAVIVWAVLP